MGLEFLTEGTPHVEAPTQQIARDQTRRLASGESEIEAERLFQLAQEAYVRSRLPPEPNRARPERLCVDMISEYHGLGAK